MRIVGGHDGWNQGARAARTKPSILVDTKVLDHIICSLLTAIMTRITNIGIKRTYVNADPPPDAVDQDEPPAPVEEPPKKKKKSKHEVAPEATDSPAKKTYRNKGAL